MGLVALLTGIPRMRVFFTLLLAVQDPCCTGNDYISSAYILSYSVLFWSGSILSAHIFLFRKLVTNKLCSVCSMIVTLKFWSCLQETAKICIHSIMWCLLTLRTFRFHYFWCSPRNNEVLVMAGLAARTSIKSHSVPLSLFVHIVSKWSCHLNFKFHYFLCFHGSNMNMSNGRVGLISWTD